MKPARPLALGPLLALALLAGGCGAGPAPAPSTSGPTSGPAGEPSAGPSRTGSGPTANGSAPSTAPGRGSLAVPRVAKRLAANLDVPWGITFLPNGNALVGSRDTATVHRVRRDGGKKKVGKVRGVVSNGRQGGEGGLLGLAVSPKFRTDHRVYAYFSTSSDNRIGWMAYRHGKLKKKVHVVLRGIPHGLHHNGGGLVFGPDGKLYASTGDSGNGALAQNRSSLGGKILRMTRGGKVPAKGNPFRGSLVYSYGHRNVEGLAFDGVGRLWATEFGDKAYDELNLIKPGRNYGWPAVQGRSSNKKYTDPKVTWRTHNAGPAGIAIVGNRAWIGALTGKRLWRVRLDGTHAKAKKAFFVGTYGRIRAVAAPPGARTIWISTSNTDGRATPRRHDDRVLQVSVG